MSNKEEAYWLSRQTVRSRIHLVHIFHGTCMTAYFGETSSATRYLIVLSVLYLFLEPRLGRRHLDRRLLFFDLSICAVTVMGAFNLTLVAWEAYPSEFELNATPLSRGVVLRMTQGQIPFSALRSAITPVLLASAGMSIQISKVVTLLHTAIFISTVVAIFMKTTRESCVFNEDGVVENICVANFVHDVSSFTMVLALAFLSCVPSAQISSEFVSLLRDGRHADSCLNHILKNSIAGAASLVELGLQDNSSDEKSEEAKGGAQHQGEFKSALEQLYHALSWCASRQVILDLAAGTYATACSKVGMEKFLKGVASSSTAQVAVKDRTRLRDRNGDGSVTDIYFDEKLARHALENAKSNAVVHAGTAAAMVVFSVKNSLPPGSKVTNRTLNELMGKVREFDATYRDAADHRNTCRRPFDESSATRAMAKHSTSILAGLPHIHLACQGAGGSFNLRLDQDDDVLCTIIFPATLVPRPDTSSAGAVSPRPLEGGGAALAAVAANVCGDASTTPSPPPSPDASKQAPAAPPPSPSMPSECKMLAIDDSAMLCKGYKRIVFPALNVNPETSEVICPTTQSHVDSFVQKALGRNLGNETKKNHPADLVLLDQNIALDPGEGDVYGTDLADTLRAEGFAGLILIRSANATDDDFATYLLSGAVDGCINKDGSNKDVVVSIRKEYELKSQNAKRPQETGAYVAPPRRINQSVKVSAF